MADSGLACVTLIDIPLERSLYVGNILSGILYGLEIFSFFASVYCISQRSDDFRKAQRFYIIYGGVLLALTTIDLVTGALWGQYMWIDHRNFPGGPLGYFVVSEAAWYNVLGMAAGATANILGDGLLVYRCYIIWGSRWYILALPTMMYLTSSVLVIISVIDWALPGLALLHDNLKSGVPWISLSVSLNIIVTSMICFRLLRMRKFSHESGSPEMARVYTNIAAMIVESAAPFSILGIGVLVTAVHNGPLTFAFGYIWAMFYALSPQMIILRVAMGRGWLKETVKVISTMPVFADPATIDMEGQGIHLTIEKFEGSMCSPATLATGSDTSVDEHKGIVGLGVGM